MVGITVLLMLLNVKRRRTLFAACLLPQIPLVQKVAGDFRKKPRRLLHSVAAGFAEAGALLRVAEIKLVPGACADELL